MDKDVLARVEQATAARLPRWGRLATLLLLGGYLLFSHGCHGDEDNEIFVGRTGTRVDAGLADRHGP
jgi:hypothetical protein